MWNSIHQKLKLGFAGIFLSNSVQCKLALTVAASVLSKIDKKPFALNISTELSLGSLSSNVLMQRI